MDTDRLYGLLYVINHYGYRCQDHLFTRLYRIGLRLEAHYAVDYGAAYDLPTSDDEWHEARRWAAHYLKWTRRHATQTARLE